MEFLKQIIGDFSGDPVVKNSPSNAGDEGSIPGQRISIPHGAGRRSSHPTESQSSN